MQRMVALTVVAVMALVSGAAAQDKKKKDEAAAGAVGPYSLPTVEVVKDKCKTSAEQNGKLEPIYKEGATKEEETKKRAKDNGTERKDLEKFLGMGKIELVNKVREILDDSQKKIFDGLVAASAPDKKKKN